MKIVIFASDAYNYRKPIADGLYRNLKELGQDVCIFYDGIHWLNKMNLFKLFLTDLYRF